MKKILVLLLGLGVITSPFYTNYLQALSSIPNLIFKGNQTGPNLPKGEIAPFPPIYHSKESKVQVALLLDTSNSMDGLIDQAKSQIWKMVNELAAIKKNGETPKIELALYHYGNSTLSGSDLFIQKLSNLSGDLDDISEKLFSLTTDGGNEYCGAVIKTSLEELEWSKNHEDLKLIIIAGNEPFSQGPINFRDFCAKAKSEGIQINTVFCGDYMEGKHSGWMEGAKIAEGKYLNINQDDKVVHIPTPYDDRILELNRKLNDTYIGYGVNGASKIQSQISQDNNASRYGSANARSRAAVKSKEAYNNSSWDLVDAVKGDASILENEESMPSELKAMSKVERENYVNKKAEKRKQIKQEILSLEKSAKDFEKKELAKNSGKSNTLDQVLIQTVIQQAKDKRFIPE